MIEVMKYVSITGPLATLDAVIEQYIARYDIQLEYAARKLKTDEGLQAFTGPNPYVEALHKSERLLAFVGDNNEAHYPMTGEQALELINASYAACEQRDQSLRALEGERDAVDERIRVLGDFTALDADIHKLSTFVHINCTYGKMPVGNYRQFEAFLYDDPEILFVQSHSDREYVWGVYFTPAAARDRIMTIFTSLHFEKIAVLGAMKGCPAATPKEALAYWQQRRRELQYEITSQTGSVLDTMPFGKSELFAACAMVKRLYRIYDMRKYAAKTQQDDYVFVGWMTRKDALALEGEIHADEFTVFSRSGDHGIDEHDAEVPPTYLRNPPVVRLFEFFTKMYGVPLYGEMDPTPIMAVVYTLLFGLMFGDVGQGFCIAALGYIAYRRFKSDLGGIMCVIGFSAAAFGFLYGSVFGMEDIIPAYWRRPGEDMNSTLIFAVGVGVCLIFMSMLLSIINSARQQKWSQLLFGSNGLAGLTFYGIVLYLTLSVVLYGKRLSGLGILAACLPLLFVALREPFSRMAEGKKPIEGGIGMFLFGTVIELYEVVLTYLANTVSFVRVGAFALSHAGMMGVVVLLSQSSAGTRNPWVMVFGNLLVMAIEGLLVGIQVLRLNYYELFSRFYEGGGRLFAPCKSE